MTSNTYRMLYVFVEGPDDNRFVSTVLTPSLRSQFEDIQIIEWSKRKKDYVKKYIESIKNMDGREYIFFKDDDSTICITKSKETILERCCNLVADRIFIVKAEIESWYLAGLDGENCKSLGIKDSFQDTDELTKEDFNRLMPRKFRSRIDFMNEILKRYDIPIARTKNQSLNYFSKKYIPGY